MRLEVSNATFSGRRGYPLDLLLYVITRGIVPQLYQSMHNTMIKLVYELVILTPSSGSIILPYILRSYAYVRVVV